MLENVEVIRDCYGQWTHPAVNRLTENGNREWIPADEWESWKASSGIETRFLMLEEEPEDGEAYISYFDKCDGDISLWNPELPGPDWRILSIHDTEDGPIAVFYRNLSGEDVS